MVSVLMALVAQSSSQIPPSLKGIAHHVSFGGMVQPCLPRQKKQKCRPLPYLLAARNPAKRLPLFTGHRMLRECPKVTMVGKSPPKLALPPWALRMLCYIVEKDFAVVITFQILR